jgi:hypothetical protein
MLTKASRQMGGHFWITVPEVKDKMGQNAALTEAAVLDRLIIQYYYLVFTRQSRGGTKNAIVPPKGNTYNTFGINTDLRLRAYTNNTILRHFTWKGHQLSDQLK